MQPTRLLTATGRLLPTLPLQEARVLRTSTMEPQNLRARLQTRRTTLISPSTPTRGRLIGFGFEARRKATVRLTTRGLFSSLTASTAAERRSIGSAQQTPRPTTWRIVRGAG